MKRLPPTPTPKELDDAHAEYLEIEPRDLFYHAATDLVKRAIHGHSALNLVESLAVLLQTWNRSYYQYHQRFDAQHFADIERVVNEYHDVLMGLRPRAIKRFAPQNEGTVRDVFASFERVLGPVGAAKCLHLLAPHFFPIWDRSIATNYGLSLGKKGSNAERYIRFMRTTQRQCRALDGRLRAELNQLKALDEYNYCRFTKHRDLTGGAP